MAVFKTAEYTDPFFHKHDSSMPPFMHAWERTSRYVGVFVFYPPLNTVTQTIASTICYH